jgi:hypothetical protein
MGSKTLVDTEVPCAYCGKNNRIIVERETVVPGTPAETEIHVRADRAGQQFKLDGEEQEVEA